jgi:hypothetical protein
MHLTLSNWNPSLCGNDPALWFSLPYSRSAHLSKPMESATRSTDPAVSWNQREYLSFSELHLESRGQFFFRKDHVWQGFPVLSFDNLLINHSDVEWEWEWQSSKRRLLRQIHRDRKQRQKIKFSERQRIFVIARNGILLCGFVQNKTIIFVAKWRNLMACEIRERRGNQEGREKLKRLWSRFNFWGRVTNDRPVNMWMLEEILPVAWTMECDFFRLLDQRNSISPKPNTSAGLGSTFSPRENRNWQRRDDCICQLYLF